MKPPYPRWLVEFRRIQCLKSLVFLYGNIYDSHAFPMKLAPDGTATEWSVFPNAVPLLLHYLKSDGYELIAYYDQLDGFAVRHSDDEKVTSASLHGWLSAANRTLPSPPSGTPMSPGAAMQVVRALAGDRRKLSCTIVNYASRFSSNPNALEREERNIFLTLLKAAQEAQVRADKEGRRNLTIVLCDKLSDIPGWLLVENPLTRGIELRRPDKRERQSYFDLAARRLRDDRAVSSGGGGPGFVEATDGLTMHELDNIITLSVREGIPSGRIQTAIDLYKYGEKENLWAQLDSARLKAAEVELKKRVMGQDVAVKKALEVVRRAKLGLLSSDARRSNKPKGVLFFAGPTGTGKTELAKSLAALVFGDEDAIIRFDMSEYAEEHADAKLIGAPPGYVGYEEGGQLTRRVRSKPFSIVLFDEIEKAHPRVFDKFLQLLDDGRLTDGKGETTYFGECLIIFTSNLGMYREEAPGHRVENVRWGDDYPTMSEAIMREIRSFFAVKLNRPEILNRFGDNFVVFDFIRPDTDRKILEKALGQIRDSLRELRSCECRFPEQFLEDFRVHFLRQNLANGGRGINNRVESHIKNGIANFLFEQETSEGLTFEAFVDHSASSEEPRVCFRRL